MDAEVIPSGSKDASRMIHHSPQTRRSRTFALAAVGLLTIAACHEKKPPQSPTIRNRRLGSAVLAVTPAINLSGKREFDANRFADLMASEASYAEGVSVVPVSRVLAVMAAKGWERIDSTAQAMELVKLVGADVVLVFAVTEYDAYDPPRIGVSAQLYGARPGSRHGSVDPVALSRQAGLAADTASGSSPGLLCTVQRVFSASDESVVEDIQRYAAQRNADGSPYGWRRYVVNQQEFIRYCCYATIREVVSDTKRFSESERVGRHE